MPKLDSSAFTLFVAVGLAAAVGAGVAYEPWKSLLTEKFAAQRAVNASQPATATTPAGTTTVAAAPVVQPRALWVASAPGRVEPSGGEIRIGPQAAGRIVHVPVKLNDQVRAGDVMVRLDDADLFIRHAAIEAEVAVRKRERDQETAPRAALDRRQAEDGVANAERAVFQARLDLDAATEAQRGGRNRAEDVISAREALTTARDKLEQERATLRRVSAQQGMPLPTRLESALTSSRSEQSLAESAIERTRVRAPIDGSVLQINAKSGETAAPGSEPAMIVFGDASRLQVRAEVEERDVAKIRVGQRVMARSDAYPGREFEGKVSVMSHALAPPRLATRGPRRPSDVDVLDVIVDLDGVPPVLPGMRVDVFFKPDATVQNDGTGRAN